MLSCYDTIFLWISRFRWLENHKSAELQEPTKQKNPQPDKTKGYKFPEAGLMENVDRSG